MEPVNLNSPLVCVQELNRIMQEASLDQNTISRIARVLSVIEKNDTVNTDESVIQSLENLHSRLVNIVRDKTQKNDYQEILKRIDNINMHFLARKLEEGPQDVLNRFALFSPNAASMLGTFTDKLEKRSDLANIAPVERKITSFRAIKSSERGVV